MSNEKKLAAVRHQLKDVARKTPEDVAEAMIQADLKQREENGEPKLTKEEIAKERVRHLMAIKGYDLDNLRD